MRQHSAQDIRNDAQPQLKRLPFQNDKFDNRLTGTKSFIALLAHLYAWWALLQGLRPESIATTGGQLQCGITSRSSCHTHIVI